MDEKQRAVNKRFVEGIFLNIAFFAFSVVGFYAESKGIGIFFAVVFVIGLISVFCVEPHCYVFDDYGITSHYVFNRKERYLWKNIRSVRLIFDTGHYRHGPIFLSNYIYVLDGKIEGEEKWYMQGYVRKSFRTKKLMEKYWGVVEKNDFSTIKKAILKWYGKKQRQVDAHFTDEAVKLEREARQKIREEAKICIQKAKKHNIDIKVKFFYVTSSGEEMTSRPDEGYRYTACAEISFTGETDEDRIVITDEDLLLVRLGKTGYKCTVRKEAEKIFCNTLEEVTSTIREKGIEFYCN